MRPIRDKLLVIPFAKKETTETGIIVPETLRKHPAKATVASVGNGIKGRVMGVKPGDVIHHVQGAGTPVEHNGTSYLILSDLDILSIE